MKIDRRTIAQLEALAKIELGPDEVEAVAEQLGRIVDFVEKVRSVDTTGVTPARLFSRPEEERLRDDEKTEGLAREDVLALAPDASNGFLRVPRVFDQGEK